MSRKKKAEAEEEQLQWISENWEEKHPYNWYEKYEKEAPSMDEIVDKYSTEERRQILVMIKVLHEVNKNVQKLKNQGDFGAGMAGSAIIYKLTLYKLISQYAQEPKEDWTDEDKWGYLNLVGSLFLDEETKEFESPLLLLRINSTKDELYQIISPDDKTIRINKTGNSWFKGVNEKADLNRIFIFARSTKTGTVARINPLDTSSMNRWLLLPKNNEFDPKDLYFDDFETVLRDDWQHYSWSSVRQVAQRSLLPERPYKSLTRMEPRGLLPYQNQLELTLEKDNSKTIEATLSNVYVSGKATTYYKSCTLCGYIVPNGGDTDHVFNLFFNTLLEIESVPEGYSDTCAACNRYFKKEKLFNLRGRSWDLFKAKAKFQNDIGGKPPDNEHTFTISDSYAYRYDGTDANTIKKTGHVRRYDKNYEHDIEVVGRDVLEDFYIRRILFLIKNNDRVKRTLDKILEVKGNKNLKLVDKSGIDAGIAYLTEKFNEELKVIKGATLKLLVDDKRRKTYNTGNAFSPSTTDKLGKMSPEEQEAEKQRIRESNLKVWKKSSARQQQKAHNYISNTPVLSGSQFDDYTNEELAYAQHLPDHMYSQEQPERFRSLMEVTAANIRESGWSGDIKQRELAGAITGKTLLNKKIYCQEVISELLANYEAIKKDKKNLELRIEDLKSPKNSVIKGIQSAIDKAEQRLVQTNKAYEKAKGKYKECYDLWHKGKHPVGDELLKYKGSLTATNYPAPSSSDEDDITFGYVEDEGGTSGQRFVTSPLTINTPEGASPEGASTRDGMFSPMTTSGQTYSLATVKDIPESSSRVSNDKKRGLSPTKETQGKDKKTTAEMGKQTFTKGYGDNMWEKGGRKKRTRRRRKKKKKRTRRRRKKKKKRTKKKRRKRKKRTRRRR